MMNSVPDNPSRREFLKAALAGGGVFLGELLLPSSARAALEELFGTQEYYSETLEELVSRLERDVYDRTTEVMWVHVEKGGKQYAVNILRESTDRSANGIDLAPLYADQEVTKAALLHTHPAALFLVDPSFPKDRAERILRERATDIPRIPSGGDLLEYMADKVRLEEMGLSRTIAHFVVEPSGTWSYDVDLEHPELKKMLSHGEADSRAEMVRTNMPLAMSLGYDLEKWSKRLQTKDDVDPQLIAEFIAWAKESYGIHFDYRKRPSV